MQRFKIPNDHTVNYCSVSASDFKALDPTLKLVIPAVEIVCGIEVEMEFLSD